MTQINKTQQPTYHKTTIKEVVVVTRRINDLYIFALIYVWLFFIQIIGLYTNQLSGQY